MGAVPQILFVEDDPEIRTLVADFLSANGLRVLVAADGRAMDRVLADHRIDLLILDVMLPGVDGLTLCRRVRVERQIPIIILTARGSEIDRIVGLELGADDYLTKPFSTPELLARIRAILRRVQALPPTSTAGRAAILKFSGWTLTLRSRRLQSADGARAPLTAAEFELLVAFCERPHRVLTREQLLELTRGRAAGTADRSIDIQVSRLRRKIEADPKEPALIQTVRSGGYIFTADVDAS